MDLAKLDRQKFSDMKSVRAYAFNPNVSDEDKQIMLDYLLEYKSVCLSKGSDFNQPKTQEAIDHLNISCDNKNNTKDNPYAHIMRNPIMVTFIGGILVLVAWQYLSPYFNN